jgi:hypothetical protein
MLSVKGDIRDFIDQVSDQTHDEIILTTNKEATAAERYCYKQQNVPAMAVEAGKIKTYSLLLKDFIIYMRHGVATAALRQGGGESLNNLPKY